MNKSKLSLSICIPVYNGEKTILQAIQSVLDAKLLNYEVLISNNASTDQTKNICLKMKKKFPDLINFYQNSINLGFAENYKKCIEIAHGQYIFFIGADDILLPKNINALLSELDYCSEIVIACSDIYTFNIDPNHIEKKFIFFDNKKRVFQKGSDSLVNWLFNSAVGSIGGYLMRSSQAKKFSKFIPSDSYVPQVHLTAYMSIYENIIHCPIFTFAQRLTENPDQMANKQYLTLHIVKEILRLINNISKINYKINQEKQIEVKRRMIKNYISCLVNNLISYRAFSRFSTVLSLIRLVIKLDKSIIFKSKFLFFSAVSLIVPQFLIKRMLFAYRRRAQ